MTDSSNDEPPTRHPEDGLISGRYRLGELLGTGGSASVFAAVDAESGQAVALKILHPHLSRVPRSREAFFDEARAASRLRHPNVVAVLGVGVHDDDVHDDGAAPLAWIALDHAPGETLADHVRMHGRLRVDTVVTIAEAVLRALEAAHGVGLIHRDVSPANIMIEPDASGAVTVRGVRLLDFGLADAAGRAALGTDVLRSAAANDDGLAELGVVGNANYMSPEQARGGAVDERGDLYQLGGVLYFALTGVPPFSRPTAAAVMRAHVQAPPPVPSVTVPGIPRSIDRIVVKALLKDPGDRYRSAAEMRAALPAPAVPPTPSSRPTASTRRSAPTVATAPALLPPDARTRVFTSHERAAEPSPPSLAGPTARPLTRLSAGRGRGFGGWIAALVVASVIAVGWLLAAGGAPHSSVAGQNPATQSAAPSETPTATATHAPTSTPIEPPTSAPVPELTFLSLDDARAALESAGFAVGTISVTDSTRAGDTVLSTSPSAGESIAKGGAIDLVVASGSNIVPAIAGLSKGDAIAALQDAGFAMLLTTKADGTHPVGAILGTEPGDGTVLRLGTTVTIVVASAPVPTGTPTPPPTGTPPPTPTATPDPEAP